MIKKTFISYIICIYLHEFKCPCTCRTPQKPEEGARFPRTVVSDDCEMPCRCWEMNLRPLQQQYVVQPHKLLIFKSCLFITSE